MTVAPPSGKRTNLREFLDDLPEEPCAVQPSFGLCTVCFRINREVAVDCSVFQQHQAGVEGELRDSVSVDVVERPLVAQAGSDIDETALSGAVPEFEFVPPSQAAGATAAAPTPPADDDDVLEAEIVEAEIVTEAPSPPGARPTGAHTPGSWSGAPPPSVSGRPPPRPGARPKPKLKPKVKPKLKPKVKQAGPPPAGTPGVEVPPPTEEELAGKVPTPDEAPVKPQKAEGFEVVGDGDDDDDVGVLDELFDTLSTKKQQ